MSQKANKRMLRKSSSQKTLQATMAQEERTCTSRRLSTDGTTISNPSFRVYYGVASAGTVPFLWESAPGTPKHAASDAALPPLTPPPSYYNTKCKSSKKLPSGLSKPASFVHSILPKLRRSQTMPSPSSKEKEKESAQQCRRKRFAASPRSSFSSTSKGEDDEADGSPTSTLCFRARHGGGRLHGLSTSVVGGQGTEAS